MPIFLLPENENAFPPPHLARDDGLLAVGGDLRPERLLTAYRMGIFPWYNDDGPILWWSPDPRLVLYPEAFRVPRRLQRTLRQARFHITFDTQFRKVVEACARVQQRRHEGTWIVPDMQYAYCRLHEAGFAHSVETWYEGKLVGGLYGVSLGGCFFGESMFYTVSNASKAALAVLVEHLLELGFELIDCQVTTDHMLGLGAREISRKAFLAQLARSLAAPTVRGKWRLPGQ